MGHLFRVFAFIFCLSLSSFAAEAQDSATTQTDGNIAAGADAVSDTDIDRRIEAIFQEIEGLDAIDVRVRSGVVTLTGSVTDATLLDQAEELAGRVDGVVAVRNNLEEVTDLDVRLVPVWERLVNRGKQAIGYLPLLTVAVVAGLLVFLAGLFVAARNWPWNRIAPNAFIAELMRQVVRLAFFVGGVVLALDILGATALLGTILGAAGIAGLAIGFAVRDTVENYIASILLSIRQPFRPKDLVVIEGYEGHVINLTSRATILMDLSGNHIRIPNATVFKANITNFTRNPERRFDFRIGVGSETALDQAQEIGLKTLNGLPFVLNDPEAKVWLEELGDSNVVLSFTGWVDQTKTDFAKARSEAMRLTKLALEENGIGLPEPIYRIITMDEPTTAHKTERPPEQTAPAKPPEAHIPADTSPDLSVERRVDEERQAMADGDLLDYESPDEFGAKPQ